MLWLCQKTQLSQKIKPCFPSAESKYVYQTLQMLSAAGFGENKTVFFVLTKTMMARGKKDSGCCLAKTGAGEGGRRKKPVAICCAAQDKS